MSDTVTPAAPAPEADPGYQGDSPDPTPRHHYGIPGQVAGAPTPPVHPDAARRAERRRARFGPPQAAQEAPDGRA